MEVKILSTNTPTQLAVTGRVDTTTAADFQTQVNDIIEQYPHDLVLDCGGLIFLSSAGLRALFVLAKKAKALKMSFTLKNVTANVLQVLKMSGFDQFFKIA